MFIVRTFVVGFIMVDDFLLSETLVYLCDFWEFVSAGALGRKYPLFCGVLKACTVFVG